LPSQSVQPDSHTAPHVAFPPTTAQLRTVCGPGGTGHATPQEPQFVGVARPVSQPFKGSPSQLPKFDEQASIAQEPAEHAGKAFGTTHTCPQAPQLAALDRTSTSQPSVALPLQLPKPSAQAATVHAPIEQLGVAFGRTHAWLHMPQWAAVVARLVSQPLVGFPSQSSKSAAQAYWQAPALQLEVLFVRAPHGTPQAPHAATSVRRSVSQPFVGNPSQSAKGAVQLPTAQTPARQTGEPFVARQRLSQRPQCMTLICGSTQAPPQQVWVDGQGRLAEQPGTHTFPTQRVPAAQCSSVRQSRQLWFVRSQWRSMAPPSETARQARSSRHPAAQRFMSATQYCPDGQRSLAGVQGTQRPVVVSQTEPPEFPAQNASLAQRTGPSIAASIGPGTSVLGTSKSRTSGPISVEGEPSTVGPASMLGEASRGTGMSIGFTAPSVSVG
jgi:hypothetical protein